ncbi:MAG: hypothetical protein ACRELS_10155 [Candidatus Rokuibacteriota bacterium]
MTRLVSLVAALGLLASLAASAAAQPLERLAGVVHVHSDLSTGTLSIGDLAVLADRQGIGALLLTENYLLRVEYGLWPFRALTRVSREEPSVLGDLEGYLDRVARARGAAPRVVLVPGVEVAPHYHWTGSPWALEMALHDTQKNLLVFGVDDPAALRGLPVIGNPHARVFAAPSLVDALPVLLIVPGAVLLIWRRPRRQRLGRAVIVVRRRVWLPGLVLVAVGGVALARGWPFTVDLHPAWEARGLAPHQTLIDHVERLGGVSVWSLPEARDSGDDRVGPVRVTWETPPYSDDLLRTFRYTAFGAVYEDTTRFERPGGGWDRLLTQYAAGERSRPAWALGESGFHDLGGGKAIGPVQTVFLVRERSPRAVLDALRAGRMYALQRTRELSLELTDFSVTVGGAVAVSGETARAAPGTPLEVAIAVDSPGRRQDLRVTLVRNGAVLGGWLGDTPYRVVHREVFDGAPLVFRLEARGQGPRLVSNPIFVKAR